ncbi:TonB-dependent receptor family protein [Chitinophaga pendula]|uniref:outer membrane beta-barrel family protein n=1 Tax=Chitinophaga TaxID=79328 RepID=UPI000BB08551|nr:MULTISPECIES: outer membrane beta-barrel family protein [Chitinophaga]ASZ11522.1 hypothetical protein CK934_11430 [Chitinophaga sp. MD30]UCJ05466.1 TonB-dependent receptor family protein [Chitinophaga pendula]
MRSALTALLLLLQIAGWAQHVITGHTKDPNGRDLPYASVALLKTKDSTLIKGTVADSAGSYRLEGIAAGNYLLLGRLTGYAPLYMRVMVPDGQAKVIATDLLMKTAVTALKSIDITAKKPYIEMLADKTILNVANNIAATGSTLFEVLRSAPGMSADKDDNLIMMGKKGVEVWINGRPSFLSGEALINWLKGQPAETVNKIELITQPSARFDAAGGAGIINIRTKTNPGNGLNGSLFGSAGIGRYVKASAGTSINFRQDKWNVFGDYNYNYSESYNELDVNSTVRREKGEEYTNRNSYWHPFTHSSNFKMGIDYQLTARTTLGVLVNGSLVNTNSMTDGLTRLRTPERPSADYLIAGTERKERLRNFRYNLNLASELDTLGSSFNTDIDVATYGKDRMEQIENKFSDQGKPATWQATIRNLVPADVDIFSIKADYTKYFNKSLKLETGFRFSNVKTDSDIRYDSLLGGKWISDIIQTSHFKYTEQIKAAYFNLSKEWTHWSIQAGLRGEHTLSEGISLTLNQRVKRTYLNLFPSLFILHKINEQHQISYSYGRRIDRPSYQELNPFVFFIDPYSRMVGNPYLAPQFTNNIEVKYGFRQLFFASIQYSRTNQADNSLVMLDTLTNIMSTRSDNNALSEKGALNLTATLHPASWWQLDATTLLSYDHYRSTTPGFQFVNELFSMSATLDQTFSLKHGWKVQLTSYYNTPMVNGQSRMVSIFSINVGIQKSIFDGQGRLRLYFQDPLNQQRWDSYIDQGNTKIRWVNRWENRRVSLSFNWKFGNKQVKNARVRTGGGEQERRRVNL